MRKKTVARRKPARNVEEHDSWTSSAPSDSEYMPNISDDGKEGSTEVPQSEGPSKKQRLVSRPKRQKTNVACRVEQYLAVVRSFSAKKKSIVRRMGFEALLDFDVNKLNRRFCMWLYRQFDPVKGVLRLDKDGAQTVVVKPNQVSWVLGVPMDGRVVPKDSKQLNASGKAAVERMKEKFRFNKEIPNQPVLDELLRDDVSEEDFKRAFLLFILGNLLCPTQSTGISPDLLPPATVALASAHYAWAPFIYDWLCKCGRRFHKDMDKVAGPQGAGGCALVLMILYLDRKPLPVSVNFYRAPRILAWCDNAVEAAIEADTVEWDTYEKALPVEGVFYGHPHPSEGFDMPWGSPVGVQWTSFCSMAGEGARNMESSERHPRDDRKKKTADPPPPFVPESDATPEQADDDKEAGPSDGGVGDAVNDNTFRSSPLVVPDATPKKGDAETQAGPSEGVRTSVGDDSDDEIPLMNVRRRSRSRRTQIPSQKKKDFHYQPLHKPARTHDQLRVIMYLTKRRSPRSNVEDEEILFQMNGMFCTASEVRPAMVKRENLGSSLVRGVALWMNSRWNDETFKSSPRLVLDPAFMQKAIVLKLRKGVRDEEYDVSSAAFMNSVEKAAAQVKSSTDVNRCSIIFVPCCLQNHWFCFAFNLRDQRLELLDSMYNLQHYDNSPTKDAVVKAFALLMSHVDTTVQMDGWEFRDAGVPKQPDCHSCGHYMLTAISLWNGNWSCIMSELESYFNSGCANLVALMVLDGRNEVRDSVYNRVRRTPNAPPNIAS